MFFFIRKRHPPISTLFPYTTLSDLRSAKISATIVSARSPPERLTSGWRRLPGGRATMSTPLRSEEHTSELQSHVNLVCRLLLEKKNRRPHARIRKTRYMHQIRCLLL